MTFVHSLTYEGPSSELISSYRGFNIIRERPYFLYLIEPRPGYDLIASLRGSYTKITTAKAQIDRFYIDWPEAGPDDAFVKIETKRGRGRPPKERTIEAKTEEKEVQSDDERLEDRY